MFARRGWINKSQEVNRSTVHSFAAKYLCLTNLSYLSKITKLKLQKSITSLKKLNFLHKNPGIMGDNI